MKKFLLLASVIAFCSSCLKNDYYNQSLTATGYNIYLAAYRQGVLALDPFNIAFRLNTLIVEGKGDPNATTLTQRNEILGPEAQILYTDSTGVYTITYTGAPATGNEAYRDFTHKGTVKINTNGYATLGEASARWTVNMAEKYTLYSGADPITIGAMNYSIENKGTNTWAVTMQNFMSSVKATIDNVTAEYTSNWTGVYQITQESGTQSASDIVKSIFSIETHINSGKTMYYPSNNMTIATPTPYKYNPQCSNRIPVGNGMMTITVTGDDANENYTEAQLLGSGTSTCNPKTRITYAGHTTDYLIQ